MVSEVPSRMFAEDFLMSFPSSNEKLFASSPGLMLVKRV
jgi:hypothetical protein